MNILAGGDGNSLLMRSDERKERKKKEARGSYMYVAVDRGTKKVVGACIDLPQYAKDTAKDVARWIRAGASVERCTGRRLEELMKRW